MLTELRVENLGIVEAISLVFGSGATAITGETGTGKTLLVDALELLVGGRADPTSVRAGADSAQIEGRFLVDGVETILTRVIPADGRSRAYRDGHMATVSEVAEIGRLLVDLHGQHAHQSLLAPAAQRAALDAFIGDAARGALTDYRAARAEVASLGDRLAALGGDERARAREAELLRFQVEELAAAAISSANEDAELLAEVAILGDAAAIKDATDLARTQIDEAVDFVGAALAALSNRAGLDDTHERARGLQAELADVSGTLRALTETITEDPQRLEAAQTRLRVLGDLRRKYGDSLTEVLEFAATIRTRLSDLEHAGERAAAIEREREQVTERVQQAAAVLHDLRAEAAPRLAVAVSALLGDLALPAARFQVEIGPGEAGEDGTDDVVFTFSANPGEPARPLTKVASGGELSRLMLALRVVLSDAPPTLVFDEVDAGIGGEAGTAVGRLLAQLGNRHQVLTVTHLAQVAAAADAQVVVEKREASGRTVASAEVVLGEARVGELSRMLAGDRTSERARKHAAELLESAGRG